MRPTHRLTNNQAARQNVGILTHFNQSSGPATLLAAFALVLITLVLSSCAGYTSAGQPTNSNSGILTPSATNVAFGNVNVGSTSTLSISISNTGTATANISAAAISGAGFTVVGGNLATSVAVGQSITAQIQYAPTTSGAASGTLTVTSDASNSPMSISLTGTGMQSAISISPANVSFGNVIVGQNGSQSVSLTNSGNTSLTINSATLSGSGFALSGLSLPVTLNAGQGASFTVQFAPASTGGATGSILVTDSAPNSPQTISLVGTGVAANQTLTVNPGSIAFGNDAVGNSTSQTVTITNTGNTSTTVTQVSATGAGFSVTGITVPVTLGAGQSTTFSAVFDPSTAGSASGSISVVSSDSDPTVAMSGTGVQGALSANPASVSFGSLLVGATSTVPVTVTNTGTANVSISAASASGSGFSMSGLTTPVTLNAGSNATFNVKFAPTAAGSATGSISITSNAPGSPLTIALTGTATAPQPQLTINPTSVSFGSVNVGSNSSQTITLSNPGTGALTISAASATGTGFTMSGLTLPATINAGGSINITAQFAPTSAGSSSGSISITSNAPGSPASIPLSGTGTQAALNANPSTYNFGSVVVGSNGTQTITLTNSGTASVTISAASVSGPGFSISGITTPVTVNAGANTSFTAKFAPTATGNASGSISITSNAPGSPLSISLSGTGTQAQLSANPTSVAFGNVTTGNTNTTPVTLTNGGTAAVTITSATVTGTGFSIQGLTTPVTINAGSNTSFSVAFDPASAGAVSGSISLVSNAPNSPLSIGLSGTGVAPTYVLTANPTSVTFANIQVGSNSSQNVTLTNTGNSNVTISAITPSGPFSASGVTPNTTLTPNQSVTMSVTFTPTSAGSATGSISVASNATGSPTVVSLSGTSYFVALSWTASSSSDVVSYNVYRGTTQGSYSKINPSPVTSTGYSDTTVAANVTYYYVVTAVDSNGVESTDSSPASANIP